MCLKLVATDLIINLSKDQMQKSRETLKKYYHLFTITKLSV